MIALQVFSAWMLSYAVFYVYARWMDSWYNAVHFRRATVRLISIDCGVRGCGVALFLDDHLHAASYIRNPMRHGQGAVSAQAMAREVASYCKEFSPTELAIETMQWYDAASQLGDQNDLGGVQLVAGAIIGKLDVLTVSYRPHDWKGTVDGDVFTDRIIERLSVIEKSNITHVSESVDHNTIDGVGVGLKRLGRMELRRVFARE